MTASRAVQGAIASTADRAPIGRSRPAPTACAGSNPAVAEGPLAQAGGRDALVRPAERALLDDDVIDRVPCAHLDVSVGQVRQPPAMDSRFAAWTLRRPCSGAAHRQHRRERVGLLGALVRAGGAARARSAAPRRPGSACCAGCRRTRSRRRARGGRGRPSRRGRWRARAARSVCHASIASVRPLNVLPSITNCPGSASWRAPRWRLLSQPRRRPWPHSAASTTRSSVWHRLDLQPAGAAAAGGVGRVERLHDHALVAHRERLVEHGARRRRRRRRPRAGRAAPRARRRRARSARAAPGASSTSSPSSVQDVEEQRPDSRRAAARGDLERRAAGRRRAARSPRRRARRCGPAARAPPRRSPARAR